MLNEDNTLGGEGPLNALAKWVTRILRSLAGRMALQQRAKSLLQLNNAVKQLVASRASVSMQLQVGHLQRSLCGRSLTPINIYTEVFEHMLCNTYSEYRIR